MSKTGARIRAEAATAVQAVRDGQSLDTALGLAAERVAPDGLPLLRALCYGTLRRWWSLSERIDPFLSRPLRKRDAVVTSLLAVGAFQLDHMRVPPHAAVTLTVDAVKALRRPKLAGLVNAVLRNLTRHPPPPPAGDEARYDHPAWMIESLKCDWPEHWQAVLEANNRQAPMWLRVNASRCRTEEYLARLPAGAALLPGFEQAIRLDEPLDVGELPGFAEGDVSVQDAAAQIAAALLGSGRHMLDLCAAPGGKAAHLLELAGPDVTLTAVDNAPERAGRIGETLDRLGLSATVVVADASRPDDWWDGRPADRVLLDAPCSATGVIRRHPDIKHLRRASDVEALATLQRRLIEAAWRIVAPGGRLVYATCSVLRAENEAVVASLLAAHPDATENLLLPNNNIEALMIPATHGYQVLPGTGDLDGFYYASLDKRA